MDGEQLNAEMAVIGGMLIDDSALHKVLGLIEKNDFGEDKNQIIFESIVALLDKGSVVSLVSVSEELKNRKKLKYVGGAEYLTQCIDAIPFTNEIQYYINIVKDKSLIRSFFETLNQIQNDFDKREITDLSEFIGDAEKRIVNVTKQRRISDFIDAKTIVGSLVSKLDEKTHKREELIGRRPPYLTGTPTGFVDLDKLIGGFQPGDLIILAARPSVGKTALALNFAAKASHQKIPVGIFSLEMSAQQVIMRLLSERSKLSTFEIEQLPLKKSERFFNTESVDDIEQQTKIQSLNKAMEILAKEPLYIDDSGYVKLIDIQAKTRKLKNNHPDLGLIVVDYIGLINSSNKNSKGDRQQEIAEISRGLKALAREIQVPILALCQLSRNVESRSNHIPQLSDLRDSGAIEQDADQVFFIYREDYYANQKDGGADKKEGTYIPPEPPIEGIGDESDQANSNSEVKLLLAKNRNGPLGTISFMFLKKFCHFELTYDPGDSFN